MSNKSPLKVGLTQINNSFSGQNYLPYSIACLQAYVENNAPDASCYQFISPIYKRIPISDAVAHLSKVSIAGFSIYVWNEQISLEIASRLKQQNPDTLIVFGGPQVPDDAESFLRENIFIDIVVHNEGEVTFLNILESYPSVSLENLTGISYIDSTDRFKRNDSTPRLKKLTDVPSPYLTDIFEPLMTKNPEETWISLWETNRGCPFQCTFCDWGSATASKVTKFELERLYDELNWFVKNKISYIFVCDANFGIQKRDVQIAEYVSKLRIETGYPEGFSVQNTKNATERAYLTQKILSDAGLNKGVALSMQSLDPLTLKNIKRDNISLETYLELSRRFTTDGVETYSDLILALPGETYDSFTKGVNKLITSGQHNRIQFNNLSILPNAEMGNSEYLLKYGMKVVKSEIINIHGSREYIDDDVPEYQDLVVETNSMPSEDWRKTRIFSWMIAFLHFDKIFQIPLILMNEIEGVSYKTLVEAFLFADSNRFPIISRINHLFSREARSIQKGGSEYVYSSDWLGIYWPADEYAFIMLTVDGVFDEFYSEAEQILLSLFKSASRKLPESILKEAVNLNRLLISQPGSKDDVELRMNNNIIEFWDNIKNGIETSLHESSCDVLVERNKSQYLQLETWCREVVWWGNKKGAYLYTNRVSNIEPQLAGHY